MFNDHESGAGGRHEDAAGKGLRGPIGEAEALQAGAGDDQGIESFVALVQRFDPGVEVAAQRADGELGEADAELGSSAWGDGADH
ncbi:hypothetical protein OHA58_31680 [Streptomyces sp. NBC_00009]